MSTSPDSQEAPDFRTRRQGVGFTVAELAHAAGVSLSFISAVEHGYRPVRSEALDRVDAALSAAERNEVSR